MKIQYLRAKFRRLLLTSFTIWLLFAFGKVIAASTETQNELTAALARLNQPDAVERLSALSVIRQLPGGKDRKLRALVPLLWDDNDLVRNHAALDLTHYGRAAFPLLIQQAAVHYGDSPTRKYPHTPYDDALAASLYVLQQVEWADTGPMIERLWREAQRSNNRAAVSELALNVARAGLDCGHIGASLLHKLGQSKLVGFQALFLVCANQVDYPSFALRATMDKVSSTIEPELMYDLNIGEREEGPDNVESSGPCDDNRTLSTTELIAHLKSPQVSEKCLVQFINSLGVKTDNNRESISEADRRGRESEIVSVSQNLIINGAHPDLIVRLLKYAPRGTDLSDLVDNWLAKDLGKEAVDRQVSTVDAITLLHYVHVDDRIRFKEMLLRYYSKEDKLNPKYLRLLMVLDQCCRSDFDPRPAFQQWMQSHIVGEAEKWDYRIKEPVEALASDHEIVDLIKDQRLPPTVRRDVCASVQDKRQDLWTSKVLIDMAHSLLENNEVGMDECAALILIANGFASDEAWSVQSARIRDGRFSQFDSQRAVSDGVRKNSAYYGQLLSAMASDPDPSVQLWVLQTRVMAGESQQLVVEALQTQNPWVGLKYLSLAGVGESYGKYHSLMESAIKRWLVQGIEQNLKNDSSLLVEDDFYDRYLYDYELARTLVEFPKRKNSADVSLWSTGLKHPYFKEHFAEALAKRDEFWQGQVEIASSACEYVGDIANELKTRVSLAGRLYASTQGLPSACLAITVAAFADGFASQEVDAIRERMWNWYQYEAGSADPGTYSRAADWSLPPYVYVARFGSDPALPVKILGNQNDNLSSVFERLISAIDSGVDGIPIRSRAFSDGFAIITRMERIDADGKPFHGPRRWLQRDTMPRSVGEYIGQLFFESPNRFRNFTLIVARGPLGSVDMSKAPSDFLGLDDVWELPKALGKTMFSEYRCYILVHLMSKTVDGSIRYGAEDGASAILHLRQSGLLDRLASISKPTPGSVAGRGRSAQANSSSMK